MKSGFKVIKNQRGQMAVFVALFFQVIFVFFAMAINVGLVVHDKINLQNAVDFAAYYGAMKQAEMLNHMAHINYQMRQNYKLFVWRYRVLGTLGNKNHPLNYISHTTNGNTGLFTEGPSWTPGVATNPTDVVPAVCVAHSYFKETKDLDPDAASICRDNDFSLPAISTFSTPTGLVPGAGNLVPSFQFLGQQLQRFCWEASVFNWFYSARILAHFRTDGLMRKRMIYALANNLSGADPKDIKGESIEEGVRKTLLNNLTNTNAASIENGSGQFRYLSSLSDGQCSEPQFWLPEIKINPVIYYNDWDSNNTSYVGGPDLCETAKPIPNRNVGVPSGKVAAAGHLSLPSAFNQSVFSSTVNSADAQYLISFWVSEPQDTGQLDTHSSVGFEKNPWCMVYSGVEANTVVRKPFDPLGSGVQLRARGFAKPFGGRMGPWYGKSWPAGTPNSQATNRNDMVDSLLPSRNISGAGVSASDFDVANHSRFPGDPFGIGSWRALSAMLQPFRTYMQHNSKNDNSPVAISNYDHIGAEANLKSHKDPLARPGATAGGFIVPPKQRPFEIAAISPDPFDALYYSIEPRYYYNYFSDLTTGRGFQSFPEENQLWDIGSSIDGGGAPSFNQGPSPEPQFNIQNQIDVANGTSFTNGTYMQGYEHVVRDWNHLLNSWHQKSSVTFDMDEARFGECMVEVTNDQYPTPGSCLYGGRVGYSVKLVSKDYLDSSDHALDGSGGGGGPLVNPPSSFGF